MALGYLGRMRTSLIVCFAALVSACGNESAKSTTDAVTPSAQLVASNSPQPETVLDAPKPDAPVARQAREMPVTYPKLAFTPNDPAPSVADVEITLTRTRCYGWCPAYTVKVRGDGTVVYEGEAYVSTIGRVESHVDPKVLEPVLNKMMEIDILHHQHQCETSIVDTPTTRIRLRVGKHSLTVEDRFDGQDCGFDKPSADPTWHAALADIGDRIDRAVGIEQWIGTDAERTAKFMHGR